MGDARPGAPDGAGARNDDWESHRTEQLLIGLRLTPAERLRWLEETVEELAGWLGRARGGRQRGGDTPVGQ